MKKQLLLGIYGGVGPLATITFEKILLEVSTKYNQGTSRVGDQGHIEWITIQATKTPDRTRAILGEVESPAPYMIEQIKKMKSIGVEAVIVACNTAHYWYQEVFQATEVPWLHLQHLTAEKIKQDGLEAVGVMATKGTLLTGLYSNTLKQRNIRAIQPESESQLQAMIMDAIYNQEYGIKYTGVKISERAQQLLTISLNEMKAQGASAVIGGCTELPMAFEIMNTSIPYYNPLLIVAQEAVKLAYDRSLLTKFNW